MNNEKEQNKLAKVDESKWFHKIKVFFRKLFNRNVKKDEHIENVVDLKEQEDISKKTFIDSVKNIEDEKTKLLKLQKQYRKGEIKEAELTGQQIQSLCDLFDKQIECLKRENEMRKNKILEYKRKLS